MNNIMEYKDYLGSVEFSEVDKVLFGKVMGVNALISYEGSTVAELIEDFHNAVEAYLALCESKQIIPEKSYYDSFVRIPWELHNQCAKFAATHHKTLNSFVEESLRNSLVSMN